MSRLAILIPLFALACDQPAPPPPPAPPPAPEAAAPPAPEAPPDAAPAPAGFTFEGEHAMALQDAAKAAHAWLLLADDAKGGPATWDAAAGYFQDAVPKETWGQQLAAVRGPLGAVKSRELVGATYTTTAPGAPDGEYVVIQYKTVFEHKAEAVETVTPMVDWDGSWKVSGYFVR